ncbi:MAG TPA: MmcQ/YjbR family DNA-binding protein [Thermomicrobiales bacterium]|nr:MmcQ/YjbR family DNA-binding protein [Thermomicrobiales bacterium]
MQAQEGLRRLRALAMGLPEAEERETWGNPTFRVRDKIFVMYRTDEGRGAAWCKAPEGVQELLVQGHPARYFVPPYVGQHGWVGIVLAGDAEWDEIAGLIEDAYRMTAPKRLVRALDEAAT